MTKHEGDIVKADHRSRITLGRHFVKPGEELVARTREDGSILLTLKEGRKE